MNPNDVMENLYKKHYGEKKGKVIGEAWKKFEEEDEKARTQKNFKRSNKNTKYLNKVSKILEKT